MTEKELAPYLLALLFVFVLMPIGGLLMLSVVIRYPQIFAYYEYQIIMGISGTFVIVPVMIGTSKFIDLFKKRFVSKGDNDKQ